MQLNLKSKPGVLFNHLPQADRWNCSMRMDASYNFKNSAGYALNRFLKLAWRHCLLDLVASRAAVAMDAAFGAAVSNYLPVICAEPFTTYARSCRDQNLASSKRWHLSRTAFKNSPSFTKRLTLGFSCNVGIASSLDEKDCVQCLRY